MNELSDYEFAPTGALLNWAFKICRESNQPMDYQSSGGAGKRGSQDVRLLRLQQAARVVGFVDAKLPDVQRALVRLCFARTGDGDKDQNQNYNLLHNWVWRQSKLDVAGGGEVANNLRVICLLVPYEIRHRVYGMKRGYSMQNLADFIDIPKTSFQRDCKSGWYAMVDLLWDERTKAFSAVDGFMDEVLRKRSQTADEQQARKLEAMRLPMEQRPALDPDMLLVSEIARYFKDRSSDESGALRIRNSAGVRESYAREADERLEKSC